MFDDIGRRAFIKAGILGCACAAVGHNAFAEDQARKGASEGFTGPVPTPAQQAWQECEVGIIYHFDLPVASGNFAPNNTVKKTLGSPIGETRGRGHEIVLAWPAPRQIDHVIVVDDIAFGERVRRYNIEACIGEAWKVLCSGESIGHKRIQRFPATTTEKIRLRVTEARAVPHIRRLTAFHSGER
jgi:hypothetical protein